MDAKKLSNQRRIVERILTQNEKENINNQVTMESTNLKSNSIENVDINQDKMRLVNIEERNEDESGETDFLQELFSTQPTSLYGDKVKN